MISRIKCKDVYIGHSKAASHSSYVSGYTHKRNEADASGIGDKTKGTDRHTDRGRERQEGRGICKTKKTIPSIVLGFVETLSTFLEMKPFSYEGDEFRNFLEEPMMSILIKLN